MRVYLDDLRKTPEGWHRTYTVQETIDLLKTGTVKELSLDNDLGTGVLEGFEVMRWLEEEVLTNGFTQIPERFYFHTDNTVRRTDMKIAAQNILRFLKE